MNPIDVSASVGVSRSSDSTRRSQSLSVLSDRELLSRVKDLVSRERAVTLEVLVHLIEVERRRLHVGLGYASMFDYCTRHLGYSSSSAARRIHTARCLRDYPEVLPLLEKNEVNLSTVSLVASILTRENYKDILERIRGKSQKEVEGIVADYRPPVSLRDRARPVWVAVPPAPTGNGLVRSLSADGAPVRSSPADAGPETPVADRMGAQTAEFDGGTLGALFARAPERVNDSAASVTGSTEAGGTVPTQRTSGCDSSRCGSEKRPNTAADSVGGPPQVTSLIQAQRQATSQPSDDHPSPPLVQKRFVQFVASERFMKKFEKAKALLSNGRGDLSYECVLEAALDEFLKDHDPEERKHRREERNKRRDERKQMAGASRAQKNETPSRHIPAAVRDAVFTRDEGRCTLVGKDGKRCETTHHLQIDHIVPFARGGTNAIGNLRLLCERHNKREAERVLGANTMRQFRRRE